MVRMMVRRTSRSPSLYAVGVDHSDSPSDVVEAASGLGSYGMRR